MFKNLNFAQTTERTISRVLNGEDNGQLQINGFGNFSYTDFAARLPHI